MLQISMPWASCINWCHVRSPKRLSSLLFETFPNELLRAHLTSNCFFCCVFLKSASRLGCTVLHQEKSGKHLRVPAISQIVRIQCQGQVYFGCSHLSGLCHTAEGGVGDGLCTLGNACLLFYNTLTKASFPQ